MSRLICVWDIDGTIANHSHRSVLLLKRCSVCLHEPMPVEHHAPCPTCGNTISTISQFSWDSFLNPDLMLLDIPIPAALDIIDRLRALKADIHFITGRSKLTSHAVTEEWLHTKVGRRPKEHLFMREEMDEGLPASQYKARAIHRLKEKIGSEGVFIFFEDDPHVFAVYDKHGIVIRCPQGLEHFMPPSSFHPEEPWRA
jgi:hypothetical protein